MHDVALLRAPRHGPQVISTARTCNLILIVLDCLKPLTHKRIIERELEGFGIRLNKKPPNITFRKKDKGGINFVCTAKDAKVDLEAVKAVCSEYRCAGGSKRRRRRRRSGPRLNRSHAGPVLPVATPCRAQDPQRRHLHERGLRH